MNTVSNVLLGALVLAVVACIWVLLTRKNQSSCSGNCAGCTQNCEKKNDP